jgi:hypothetical protein
MKKTFLLCTLAAVTFTGCFSPRNHISEEEWDAISASVTSSMKFYIAVEKTEAQAQERYGNRYTLEYWEWDTEECIHEIRRATLKRLVSYFYETSEWATIPTMQEDFNANEIWREIKDTIPSALKKLGNSAAIEQVTWTIDNLAREYGRLDRVEFKHPEFVSKSDDREVFKSYCTYNDTYYKIVRTSDGRYLWDFSTPFFEF